MARPPRHAALALFLLTGLWGGHASGQFRQSHCADCHLVRPDAPGGRHVSDWDRSAHARNGVGCDSCHGGNPTTFDPFQAHQGILHYSNPASPVARANLAGTCGRCHAGPFVAFQKSRHYELVRGGDRDAPTCTTCHDEVGAFLPSPKQIEGRCAGCHGASKVAPRVESAAQARSMLEGIRDARVLLKEAKSFIRRIDDKSRRARLEAAAEQAAIPLIQAADAGHAFVFDDLQERLTVARQRIAALYEELVNPATR